MENNLSMKVTCGVFIFDINGLLLIGHPTGFPYNGNLWSIPKGEPDDGETPDVTAIRETWEEASIRLEVSQLKYVGPVAYKSGKKTIYAYVVKLPIDGKTLKPECTSKFVNKEGNEIFEIDAFRWVTQTQAINLLHEAQVKLLDPALKIIGNG